MVLQHTKLATISEVRSILFGFYPLSVLSRSTKSKLIVIKISMRCPVLDKSVALNDF